MADKQTTPRRKLPAGTLTVTVCSALVVLVILGADRSLLPVWLAGVATSALLLLQPLAVHALQRQVEVRRGAGASGWAALRALGSPLLVGIAPVALLTAIPWASTSLLVVGACLVYQLAFLRRVAVRSMLPMPLTPTREFPRLAGGPQRDGLLACAARCGVELADVRVELDAPEPAILCGGGHEAVALVTEGALERLDAPAREALLALELQRRRTRAPLVFALLALIPLLTFAWLDTVLAYATWVEVAVAFVPYAYIGALVLRLLDALGLRAARRACSPEAVDAAIQVARERGAPWLWAGPFLDLWQGDAIVMFVRSRSRLASAALAVQALGLLVIPLVALGLPLQAAGGVLETSLGLGAAAALIPPACSWAARLVGLRLPLDGVRMLVTAPPAWAAYLTLLFMSASYRPGQSEANLVPLCFLATGIVLSWALLPGVRRMVREDEDP